MKIRSPLDRNDLKIRKQHKVVEIGSGHNPTIRANVIVEKYINDNTHRCGNIKIYPHQIFINADGENMPFENKEFDYAICCQVLEHVDHPAKFISELCRVAKRGYIETPSLIGEFLFPKKAHRWVILDIDQKLVIFEKAQIPGNYIKDYGELFLNYLAYQSLPYKILGFTEGNIMINRYEWKDNIDILLNPEDDYYRSFFTRKWSREMTEKLFPPRSLRTELFKTLNALFHIIKYEISRKMKRLNQPIELEKYLKLKGKIE